MTGDPGPFREGRVHVCADLCSTCVFRPGNLMKLEPGRLRGMVKDSLADDAAIQCHHTLDDERPSAVCRGYYDRHAGEVTPLRMAGIMGLIEFDEPG